MNHENNALCSRTISFFFTGWILLFSVVPFSASAKIVFCVDDDIYVMDDDGSRRRRLTHNTTALDTNPRWSPDGRKIAFTRYIDKTKSQTTAEVFIMNADGTDLKRLTHNNVLDTYPSWSPDGDSLAFSGTQNGRWEVFVIELATGAIRQLTGPEDGVESVGSAAPDWSPDGRQITFERFIRVNGIAPKTIYVMDADGQHQRPILRDPPLDGPTTLRYFPRWSADGQRILFYESKWFKEGDVLQLIVQRIGGTKQEITDINDRLGNNFLIAGASWMENDRAVLFALKRLDKPNSNYNLYRYTFGTRGLRRLTRETSDEKWPDWIEGALAVSPRRKLTTLWGEIKKN